MDQKLTPTTLKASSQSVLPRKENKSSNPVGRPTKYSEEVLIQAENYLQRIKDKEDIPYLSELASELDITTRTIENWVDEQGENSEFFRTIKRIVDYQEFCLEKGALVGKYNPTSAIFQLKTNHGKIEANELRMKGEIKTFSGADYIGEHNDKTNS